jgi:hypothetical protein
MVAGYGGEELEDDGRFQVEGEMAKSDAEPAAGAGDLGVRWSRPSHIPLMDCTGSPPRTYIRLRWSNAGWATLYPPNKNAASVWNPGSGTLWGSSAQSPERSLMG